MSESAAIMSKSFKKEPGAFAMIESSCSCCDKESYKKWAESSVVASKSIWWNEEFGVLCNSCCARKMSSKIHAHMNHNREQLMIPVNSRQNLQHMYRSCCDHALIAIEMSAVGLPTFFRAGRGASNTKCEKHYSQHLPKVKCAIISQL